VAAGTVPASPLSGVPYTKPGFCASKRRAAPSAAPACALRLATSVMRDHGG
jgi:hypothetical protein